MRSPSSSKIVCACALAVLFALPSPVPLFAADCAECVPRPEGAKLCATHAEQEAAALASLKTQLKNATDPAGRIQVLEQIAALTTAHANAPGKAVAEALALGFKDEKGNVRLAAARLLGAGQHEQTARTLLSNALTATRKSIDKNCKKKAAVIAEAERREKEAEKRDPGGKGGDVDLAGALEKLSKLGEFLKPIDDELIRDGDLLGGAAAQLVRTGDVKLKKLACESLETIATASPESVTLVTEALLSSGAGEDVRKVVAIAMFRRPECDYSFFTGANVQKRPDGSVMITHLANDLPNDHNKPVYEQLRAFAAARKLSELPPYDAETFATALAPWVAREFPKK